MQYESPVRSLETNVIQECRRFTDCSKYWRFHWLSMAEQMMGCR